MFRFFFKLAKKKFIPLSCFQGHRNIFFVVLFTIKRFQTYLKNFYGIGRNWITVDALNNLTKLASWTDEFISCDECVFVVVLISAPTPST